MEKILKLVCDYYKIPKEEMFTKARERRIVRPRQMFYLLMFENMHHISVSACARLLNQTHATVLYAIKKMNDEISVYPEIRNDYDYLSYRIDGNFKPKDKYFEKNNRVYCNWCIYVRP